jgi:hypothetical protein
MHVRDEDNSEFGGWDRGFTKRLIDTARPIGKRWYLAAIGKISWPLSPHLCRLHRDEST